MEIGPAVGVRLNVGLHGLRQIGKQRFEIFVESGLEGVIHPLLELFGC
jgi:hypothetical protein